MDRLSIRRAMKHLAVSRSPAISPVRFRRKTDEFRESRKFVPESLVRTPLKSLAPEPVVDSFGDGLPSGLKHHDVPHVRKDLHICLVSLRESRHVPVDSHAVVLCSENKYRCFHEVSVGEVASSNLL